MSSFAGLVSVLVGTGFAWAFGIDLAGLFGWDDYSWLGQVLMFVGTYLVSNAFLSLAFSVLVLSGGGLWTASPVRWIVGKIAFLLLLPAPFLIAAKVAWLVLHIDIAGELTTFALHPLLAFVPYYFLTMPPGTTSWMQFEYLVYAPVIRAIEVNAVFAAVLAMIPAEKRLVAYGTLPLRRLWRALKTGVGGSSAFDGLLDEWLTPWKPGRIMVGTSLYEPGQKLGKANEDRHFITIATTRSGKGRSAVIPALLEWPGSVLVIDPKGENAAVTAVERRIALDQSVHILDPFGVLERLGLDPTVYPSQRFNPLAEINLDDRDVVEQIRNLAAALVMPSPHANPFWDNASKQILAGVIAFVLASPALKHGERHLGTVRDIIAETNGRKMLDLAAHPGVAGLASVAVAELKRASNAAGGDILTTLAVHMEWLDSLAMRDTLSVSDFSLGALKDKQASVYLVVPPEYLETHARFLRLFITQALRAAGRGRKSTHPMLFVLDEFAALGHLKVVEEAAGQLAGMGVKLWPIIQNLTQLRQYGDNWEVFLANAGQQQVFAMNDQMTARYFSERLGHHIAWRKVRNGNRDEWVPQGPTLLRTTVELARESSRDSGKALIFNEGGAVSLVRRGNYDRLFDRSRYSPNPYQSKAPLFSLAAIRAEGGFEQWWEGRFDEEWVAPKLAALEQWWTDRQKSRD